jgi:hypothetical protein
MTYFLGGFVLVHDMVVEGAMARGAVADLTGWLAGNGGVGGGSVVVDREAVQLARALETLGLVVAVVVLLSCLGVFIWTAIMA